MKPDSTGGVVMGGISGVSFGLRSYFDNYLNPVFQSKKRKRKESKLSNFSYDIV